MEKQTILIAGGTGLIGREMQEFFIKAGHEVRILSRKPSDHSKNLYHWEPSKKEIDLAALKGITTLVNLSGAGIADKRWTATRKKELIDSRVEPALFLASLVSEMPELKQYIASSGINCYDYNYPEKVYVEHDAYASDFLSQVVRKWEEASDSFLPFCKVAKIRTSLVVSKRGGALETIAKPMKFGLTSALGSGKQWMPWIHIHDLVRIFDFAMVQKLEGSFNAVAEMVDNETFTKILAKQLDKKMWLPNVPGFLLKIALGEMSTIVLEGVNASNQKLKDEGFKFEFEDLPSALKDLYRKG